MTFADEANETLAELKAAIARALEATRIVKPGDLQRTLHLDATLSYALFRISGEPRALAVGSWIPSRVSIEKFLRGAAKRGVGSDLLDDLSACYGRFERLVERHAGDRQSFNSLVTGIAGPTDEWLGVDLQHRRNAFRAMSHITGVQAKARILTNVIGLGADGSWDAAYAVGYAGLRVLRDLKRVCVHGLHLRSDDSKAFRRQRLGLSTGDHQYLLDRYSTVPVPPLVVDQAGDATDGWIQTSLVAPEVGNLGASTLVFGERVCHRPVAGEHAHYNHTVMVPTERLVHDVIVQPGLIKGRPRLRAYLGSDRQPHRMPDAMDLEGNYRVEFVGKGTGGIAVDEFPRYPDLVGALAAELQCDIDSWDVWRVSVDFPVYQSSTCVSWRVEPHP